MEDLAREDNLGKVRNEEDADCGKLFICCWVGFLSYQSISRQMLHGQISLGKLSQDPNFVSLVCILNLRHVVQLLLRYLG